MCRPHRPPPARHGATAPRRSVTQTCRSFTLNARNYQLEPEHDAGFVEFQQVILEQDRVVVVSKRPEELPVDLSEELHIKGVDRVSIDYRRGLGELIAWAEMIVVLMATSRSPTLESCRNWTGCGQMAPRPRYKRAVPSRAWSARITMSAQRLRPAQTLIDRVAVEAPTTVGRPGRIRRIGARPRSSYVVSARVKPARWVGLMWISLPARRNASKALSGGIAP
jgi:hypothetical protein